MTEHGESLGAPPELRRVEPGEEDPARPDEVSGARSRASETEPDAARVAVRETVKLDLSRPAGPARTPDGSDRDVADGDYGDDVVATMDTVLIPHGRPGEDVSTMETVLLPRGRPAGTRRPRGAPLPVAALVNTGWAALQLLGPLFLLTVAVRAAEGPIDWALSLRFVLAGWLLGHGVPLTVALDGRLGAMELAPLALTALALWRVSRAGVHTTRAIGAQGSGSFRQAALAAGAVGLVYGVFGVAAAALAQAPGLLVLPWRAGLHCAVLGLAAGALGSVRAGGVLRRLARSTPVLLRDGVRAGVVAALLVLAVGAGAVGLAVAINGGEAARDMAGFSTGVLGQAGLTLLSLAYGPNLAVWAASYLLGPGFAAGTLPLTQLPVFAGVPDGPLRGAGWLLTVLPLLAGAAAAVLMARRRLRPRRTRHGDVVTPPARWLRMCGSALAAGVVAGLLLAAAAYASGGALPVTGAVRTGPVVWQVALMAALVVTLGGLLGVAGFWSWRGFRRQA
ncbi:DUF6350 family protein [Catellatospora bangladeshensis]|nr:DUF6350 family protein [Catellatospora bangladeshensis]